MSTGCALVKYLDAAEYVDQHHPELMKALVSRPDGGTPWALWFWGGEYMGANREARRDVIRSVRRGVSKGTVRASVRRRSMERAMGRA